MSKPHVLVRDGTASRDGYCNYCTDPVWDGAKRVLVVVPAEPGGGIQVRACERCATELAHRLSVKLGGVL